MGTKFKLSVVFLFFAFVLIYPATAVHTDEFKICTDISSQINPDVDLNGAWVVWQDNRNDNWDIYLYVVETGETHCICAADGNQTNPSIEYENVLTEPVIVWQDDRNGNADIYGYVLDLDYYPYVVGQEFPICTDPCVQINPVTDSEYVYWQDNRNGDWDIYAADIKNPDEPNELSISVSNGEQINPSASWGAVAWQDSRNGNWDIYAYDIDDGNEYEISVGDGNQTNPSYDLSGEMQFVWQDDISGNSNIYAQVCDNLLCIFEDMIMISITSDSKEQINPSLSVFSVIWQDNFNGDWDLRGYKMINNLFGEYFTVVERSGNQFNAAYSEGGTRGLVVWQDDRNGNDDIYGSRICLTGNDYCDDCAIELLEDEPYYGTTEGMMPTGPLGDPCSSSCGYNDFIDVWHIYTPVTGGPITISTQGSTLDTILSVYNSCLLCNYPDHDYIEPSIELACNDDFSLASAASKVMLNAVGGKDYYIRVSGYNNQTGDYRIVINKGAETDPITSDLNGDGKVDMQDFAIFSSEWLFSNEPQDD